MLLRDPRVVLTGIGVAAAILAAASLRFFQYEPIQALGGEAGLSEAQPNTLEADKVQVVGHSGGKVGWRFAAQTVALSRDRRIISVGGIRQGTLYAPDRAPAVSLTAEHASYETPFGMLGLGSAGLLRVQGDVKAQVLTAAHPALSASLLVWDSQSNTLSSPLAVTATLPKLIVSAGSAVYASPPGAPAHGTMHLAAGVHARFDSTRGAATLDCPGLTWSADGQTAQTTGPVTARIPGGLGTATADSITVNTHTGDLTGHGLRGTLLLSREVQ